MSTSVKKKTILDADAIRRSLVRISHEIVEKNKGVENVVLVGIRTRGVPLAQRLAEQVAEIEGVKVPVVPWTLPCTGTTCPPWPITPL